MRRLILHAGRAKTGTTALQHFLAGQGDLLWRLGILYPKAGSLNGGHHPVAGSLAASPPGWTGAAQDFPSYVRQIRDEAAEAGAETVLLSSEAFQGKDVTRFAAEIPGLQIEVILGVRRYDRFYESLVAQDIKVGVLATIPDFTAGFYNLVLAHAREAGHFTRLLGPKAVTLFFYPEGGDVRREFLGQLGLAAPLPDRAEGRRANATLTTTDTFVALLLNRFYPGTLAPAVLARALRRSDRVAGPDWWKRGLFLAPDRRRQLLRLMAQDAEILCRRHGLAHDLSALDPAEDEALAQVHLPPADEVFFRLGQVLKHHTALAAGLDACHAGFSGVVTPEDYRAGVARL